MEHQLLSGKAHSRGRYSYCDRVDVEDRSGGRQTARAGDWLRIKRGAARPFDATRVEEFRTGPVS
jgi:hypothetical protein